jgi:hypothetical protein
MMMRLLEPTGGSMKELYSGFLFFVACVMIFGSGYFFAKPHSEADRTFAPLLFALAVYHLWRGRAPTSPSLPHPNSQ